MRYLKIIALLFLTINLFSQSDEQIPLYRVEYAPDSSGNWIVRGRTGDGEPIWSKKDSLGFMDSLYINGIWYYNGDTVSIIGGISDTLNQRGSLSRSNDSLYYKQCPSCPKTFVTLIDTSNTNELTLFSDFGSGQSITFPSGETIVFSGPAPGGVYLDNLGGGYYGILVNEVDGDTENELGNLTRSSDSLFYQKGPGYLKTFVTLIDTSNINERGVPRISNDSLFYKECYVCTEYFYGKIIHPTHYADPDSIIGNEYITSFIQVADSIKIIDGGGTYAILDRNLYTYSDSIHGISGTNRIVDMRANKFLTFQGQTATDTSFTTFSKYGFASQHKEAGWGKFGYENYNIEGFGATMYSDSVIHFTNNSGGGIFVRPLSHPAERGFLLEAGGSGHALMSWKNSQIFADNSGLLFAPLGTVGTLGQVLISDASGYAHWSTPPPGGPDSTSVANTATVNLSEVANVITATVNNGSITPVKLDRTYIELEVDGDILNERGSQRISNDSIYYKSCPTCTETGNKIPSKADSTSVANTATVNLSEVSNVITANVNNGSITPAKLDRTYVEQDTNIFTDNLTAQSSATHNINGNNLTFVDGSDSIITLHNQHNTVKINGGSAGGLTGSENLYKLQIAMKDASDYALSISNRFYGVDPWFHVNSSGIGAVGNNTTIPFFSIESDPTFTRELRLYIQPSTEHSWIWAKGQDSSPRNDFHLYANRDFILQAGRSNSITNIGGNVYIQGTAAKFVNWGTLSNNNATIIDQVGTARLYQLDASGTLKNIIQAGGNSYILGNLGIGNSSPVTTLDVTGTFGVSTLSATATTLGGWSSGNVATKLTLSPKFSIVSNGLYFTEGDSSNTNEIELPTQTGNSGKYLTTNGTTPSWATVVGGSAYGNYLPSTRVGFGSAVDTITSSANLTYASNKFSVLGYAEILNGYNSTFISGGNNTATGTSNVALGRYSLLNLTSGTYNTAIGYEALGTATNASHNFALGYRSQYSSNAQFNLSIGYSSLKNGGTGNMIAFGYEAGENATGSFNILGGSQVAQNFTGSQSIGFGQYALYQSGGSNNIALGKAVCFYCGSENTIIGYEAFSQAVSTGVGNTGVGYWALRSATGNYNVSVGQQAGQFSKGNTVALGVNAGYTGSSGSVFLGANAGYSEAGNNKLYIDNSSTTSPLLLGDFAADSLRINGALSVRDVTFTPTTLAGFTGGNKFAKTSIGSGLILSGSTLDAVDASNLNEINVLGGSYNTGTNILNITATNGGGSVNFDLSDLQDAGLSGSGTTNYVPKWSSSTALTNSGMYEASSGVFGVNTTSPASYLATDKGIAINGTFPALGFNNGSGYWVNYINGGDYRVYNSVYGTDVFAVKNSGFMGIGTTSPVSKLHVNGDFAVTDLTATPSYIGAWSGGNIASRGTLGTGLSWVGTVLTLADVSASNEINVLSLSAKSGITVPLTSSNGGGTINFKEGSGITLTRSSNDLTIASTATSDGNGIYDGSGSLSGNTTVSQGLYRYYHNTSTSGGVDSDLELNYNAFNAGTYSSGNYATFHTSANRALMSISVSGSQKTRVEATTSAINMGYDSTYVLFANNLAKLKIANSFGTSGQVLTSGGSGSMYWADVSTLVNTYTSSSTWTKPSGCKTVTANVWGGGGGAGGGSYIDTGNGSGGGGGAGGGYSSATFDCASISGTVSITVGGSASGGGDQFTSPANGNNGTAGNASTFGSYLGAAGGAAGQGGQLGAVSAGGAAGAGVISDGGAGGGSTNSATSGTTGGRGKFASGGGNGGAGVTTVGSGTSNSASTPPLLSTADAVTRFGSGGAGAAAANTGSNGANYGAGGGGGAGYSGTHIKGGGGGNGAPGYVMVITHF